MTQVKSYRDLIAWQKGMDLVTTCYRESAGLPADEKYGLSIQMRRSAVGIPSNIAEGWGRRSTREYIRFLRIALGSAYELLTQIEIAQRLELDGDWDRVHSRAEEVSRILNGLIKSVRSG